MSERTRPESARMAHTPGWNDPPPLSFSQCSQPGTKRTLLNKRVPYPFTQVSPPLNSEISPKTPPFTTDSISPNLGAETLSLENVENQSVDRSITTASDEEILSNIMSIFEKVLSENFELHEKKKIEEINRRLDVMKNSWDTKISSSVKHKMLNLAEELSKGDAESALKIQCALMVEHLREVKQWMVGVKHIIEMERLKAAVECKNDFS